MNIPDDPTAVPPLPEIRRAPDRGRVLCFAPHPDDEAAGPGGTLLLHRRQGDPVRIVLATDGIAGDPDGKYDAATYAERRRNESREGMRLLDCEDFVFWGFPDSCVITDGDLDYVAQRCQAELDTFRPDVVYLPWEGEGNSDHRAVYAGVVRGLRRAGFAGTVLGYEIWNAMIPDVIVDITAVVDDKRAAMARYESQLAYVDYLHPVFGLNAHRSLLFNKGRGYGEAFRIVREHCA
ncbi:MAG: PIG-L deacetylase family protein [Planctomycetota bacterium]